jgi:group II intron reverse transcriptase/maturase
MRTANTILGIIRDRGMRGLPLEDVYRQLYNPELYLLAYGKIAKNQGAMTPGVLTETVDGMSLKQIQAIIDAVRYERYRWKPAKRIYIEKKGSVNKRPLGLPSWSDKVLQEVIRTILEAYYEPRFSDRSHGFRPTRGCHTALRTIYRTWRGTNWFIEGDIAACFDSLSHEIMLNILRQEIHDNRFMRLIEHLLKAGYLEDWTYHETFSGVPQGGIVSPTLSNIYLDRLDQFVENTLLPEYNRGKERQRNPAYYWLTAAVWRARRIAKDRNRARALAKRARALPSRIPNDPTYRRLRYVRYADDFLLGLCGTRAEAEDIKQRLGAFLEQTLRLELSKTKTLVTHAVTGRARFLGYEISSGRDDQRRNTQGERSINWQPTLRVPRDRIQAKCKTYLRHGKPIHRKELTMNSDFSIIADYQAEYRGVVNYYRMATNLGDLSKLRWTMETSLTKTLAHKFKATVSRMYRRYAVTIDTPHGRRKVLRVVIERAGNKPLVAQWGAIPLRRDVQATLDDKPPQWQKATRTELVERLLADTCELCGSHVRVEVHHIRKLRDLRRPGKGEPPAWVRKMAARQRKTLVVCWHCHHHAIHGKVVKDQCGRCQNGHESLESRMN